MSFQRVLQKVTTALNEAGIAHMLTGSFASAFYGSPRSTRAIDLVIAADSPQIRAFVQSLPTTEYHADMESALDALARQSMFTSSTFAQGGK